MKVLHETDVSLAFIPARAQQASPHRLGVDDARTPDRVRHHAGRAAACRAADFRNPERGGDRRGARRVWRRRSRHSDVGADGWIAAGFSRVWQIALFLALGESFTAFGGAMALAALAGAVSGLLLGRFIDAGHGGRAVWLAAGSLVVVIALRAVSWRDPVLAVMANAAGALVPALYVPTMMTAVYSQAKASPCALRFQIAAEGGWDAGAASGCMVAAALLWVGAPISPGILLSLLGTAAIFVLLRRYYGEVGLKALPPFLGPSAS